MRCGRCSLKGKCRSLRTFAKKRFGWTFHNLIAHPLSELFWIVGLEKLSDKIHNLTIPKEFRQ